MCVSRMCSVESPVCTFYVRFETCHRGPTVLVVPDLRLTRGRRTVRDTDPCPVDIWGDSIRSPDRGHVGGVLSRPKGNTVVLPGKVSKDPTAFGECESLPSLTRQWTR